MFSIFKDAPIIPSKQMIVQQSTFWRARYVRLQGMERNEFPKLTRNGIPLHDDWFQTCLFLNLLLGTCNLRAFLCQRVETRAVPVFPIGWSCLCPSLRLGCCKQQWLAAARSQLICLHGVKVNFVQTLWLLGWGNPKKWTTEPLSWFLHVCSSILYDDTLASFWDVLGMYVLHSSTQLRLWRSSRQLL